MAAESTKQVLKLSLAEFSLPKCNDNSDDNGTCNDNDDGDDDNYNNFNDNNNTDIPVWLQRAPSRC